MASTHQRILVWLKKSGNKAPQKANFIQSILDVLGEGNDIGFVYASLENNRLLLSEEPCQADDNKIKMKRPSFCPIHNIKDQQIKEIPEEILQRGIDCGAATILESGDGKILLTRRAHHLRTFPGIWVPPGGHIEADETFLDAALRELYEETGLMIKKEWCENGHISTLALWESVFPPKLSAGLPKRHHAVIYVYAKLKPSYTANELQKELNLCPKEVGASAWFDKQLIEAIVKTIDYEESGKMPPENFEKLGLPKYFKATVLSPDEKTSEVEIETSSILTVATGNPDDCERVSTGTKFALGEWLNLSMAPSLL